MNTSVRNIIAAVLVVLAMTYGGLPGGQAQVVNSSIGVKIFHLENISAVDALNAVQKLFPKEFEKGEGLTQDARANTLVVRAPVNVVEQIEAILQSLDQPTPAAPAQKPNAPDAEDGVKSFRLKNVSSAAAAKLINELYSTHIATTNATISSEPRTNTLWVRGPASLLMTIEATVLHLEELEQHHVKGDSVQRSKDESALDMVPQSSGMEHSVRGRGLAGSVEFQQYEQAAQAAAQAYRQELAAAPRDEAKLAQLKADLQGAVHSAFHARQTWQRKQIAEMRQRLNDIEKNVSSRSQRSNEIVERRVEDLLNPERKWETPDEATRSSAIETTANDHSYPSNNEVSAFPTEPQYRAAIRNPQSVWLTDHAIATAKFRRSKRPLVYFFYKTGDQEPELLHSEETLRTLNAGFIAVKLDAQSDEAVSVMQSFTVSPREFPMLFIVTDEDESFGPYRNFSKTDGAVLVKKLQEIQDATKSPISKSNQQNIVGGMGGFMGGSGAIPGFAPTLPGAQTRLGEGDPIRGPGQEAAIDPRRGLLEAENAVMSAEAAVAEAEVNVEASGASLPRLVEAYKKGAVSETKMSDAQTEARRAEASLNRARADLQGKERLLELAKEQLVAQINQAEFDLEHAKAQLDLARKQETRAVMLYKKQAVSQEEYDKMVAEVRVAQVNYDRASARYAMYRRGLPGQDAGARNKNSNAGSATDRPAEKASLPEKRGQ